MKAVAFVLIAAAFGWYFHVRAHEPERLRGQETSAARVEIVGADAAPAHHGQGDERADRERDAGNARRAAHKD